MATTLSLLCVGATLFVMWRIAPATTKPKSVDSLSDTRQSLLDDWDKRFYELYPDQKKTATPVSDIVIHAGCQATTSKKIKFTDDDCAHVPY